MNTVECQECHATFDTRYEEGEVVTCPACEERFGISTVLAATEKSGDELAGILIGDAKDTVTSDRDTHGDAVENQEHIATGWTWYLRGLGLLGNDEEITGGDVGRMMGLVKMSRTAVGTYDVDHDRDVAGYAGIAAACEVERGNAEEEDLTR